MTDEQLMPARVRLQTESGWPAWEWPHQILRLHRGKVKGRKARLVEAACLRRLWHWPEVAKAKFAVEVLERHAEGTWPYG
jgi:hypothetical protein